MLAIPGDIQFKQAKDYLRLLGHPTVWFLLIALGLHIATYPGQVRSERKVEEMKLEFRKWWEYSGKTMLSIQGINPEDPSEYNRRLDDYIRQYTSHQRRYQIQLVPNTAQPHQFFSTSLLQPGWASLALFSWFFLYAGLWLEARWGRIRAFGIFILSCAAGNSIIYVVSGILFRQALDNPFTGTSAGLAVCIGALVVTHGRDGIPLRIPFIANFPLYLPPLIFGGTWFLLDSLINWFVNPALYSAIIPIDFLFFPLGIFLGLRLPMRQKTARELRKEQLQASLQRTVDIAEENRSTHRTYLAEGFAAATRREFQTATEQLSKGLAGLLHESPLDDSLIENTVERMTHPDMLIDIPGNQWLEWGNLLAKANLARSSIFCLEKNLSQERDERFARMALLLCGAQRVKFGLEPDKGLKMLEKVVQLNKDDLHGKRASDMITKFAANATR